MSGAKRLMTGWCVVVLLACAFPSSAVAQNEGISQYRAAVTRIFIWKYSAFPIFRQNPIFPGAVVRLEDETIKLDPARCYPGHKGGNYRAINDYTDGMAISRSSDLRLKGDLLTKKIAEVETNANVKTDLATSITVTPLSEDRFMPDTTALRSIASDSSCQLILQLLDRKTGEYVIAAEVLHGIVRYQVGLTMAATVSAAARSQLLAAIAKTFQIKDAEIGVGLQRVSFSVAKSPDAQTLAIVPPGFHKDELARITYYLQGKRGADLETAVDEALATTDVGTFRKLVTQIRALLGDKEINQKERWTERFVRGPDTATSDQPVLPIAQLRTQYREQVDFRKLGTYAAAMELVSPPPPQNNQ